jgi:hypothetical protein
MQTYPSLQALPEPVDLAVIAVPKDAVLSVLDDCAATGVPRAGGHHRRVRRSRSRWTPFARPTPREGSATGPAHGRPQLLRHPEYRSGRAAQRHLRIHVSPSPAPLPCRHKAALWGLALLAASERFAARSFHLRQRRQQGGCVGSTTSCNTGRTIPQTRVILLYVESFGNPRRFAQIARRVSRNKPIVVLKAGPYLFGQTRRGIPHGCAGRQ